MLKSIGIYYLRQKKYSFAFAFYVHFSTPTKNRNDTQLHIYKGHLRWRNEMCRSFLNGLAYYKRKIISLTLWRIQLSVFYHRYTTICNMWIYVRDVSFILFSFYFLLSGVRLFCSRLFRAIMCVCVSRTYSSKCVCLSQFRRISWYWIALTNFHFSVGYYRQKNFSAVYSSQTFLPSSTCQSFK